MECEQGHHSQTPNLTVQYAARILPTVTCISVPSENYVQVPPMFCSLLSGLDWALSAPVRGAFRRCTKSGGAAYVAPALSWGWRHIALRYRVRLGHRHRNLLPGCCPLAASGATLTLLASRGTGAETPGARTWRRPGKARGYRPAPSTGRWVRRHQPRRCSCQPRVSHARATTWCATAKRGQGGRPRRRRVSSRATNIVVSSALGLWLCLRAF